ncbi:MAG TPA: hypothetical protein VGF53_13145 [Pseudolabrys sp.]|jgi:hypothetical protein
MREKVSDAPIDPEFFPASIEFLGFIGGWGCESEIGTVHRLFYLIRTSDLDWLEEVVKYFDQIVSRKCVGSIPRDGSKREAAARLLDAHVRSRVHIECPVLPYRTGLLTNGELESIVNAIAGELKRNSEAAEEAQRRQGAPIIKMATELNLKPRPAGHNDNAWMASCPGTNHWLMILARENQFGCGWCKREGGPEELHSFYNERKIRSGSPRAVIGGDS